MRRLLYISMIALAFTSCARLDDFMFNNDNTISAYLLDNYEGEVDFTLNGDYDIADKYVKVFKLKHSAHGERISAIYIGDTSRMNQDTVIMYCHGNKDHMDFYWQRAKLLANAGGKNRFGVMMIDYRGFGTSEGSSTESGLNEDVELAIKWLKSKGVSADKLAIYGFSLGSAPATLIAREGELLTPGWLILEAPFASTDVMASDASLLDMPASFYLNGKYDNAEEIKFVEAPFLWMHGVDDHFLNLETHGEVVFKNYRGDHSYANRIAGAGHSTLPEVMGFEKYNTAITAFITNN